MLTIVLCFSYISVRGEISDTHTWCSPALLISDL